jgi:hypothetical protein
MKKVIRFLLSTQMTVVCLLLMAALVIWGTIYESSEGLFAARERFFQSWLTGYFIPFPGIKLISLLLIINMSGSFFRLCRKPIKYSGLILLHLGIALLVFGMIFSSQFTREYFLPLQEGETASSAYNPALYEIALHKQIKNNSNGYYTSDSILIRYLENGKDILFPNSGLKLKVKNIHKSKDSDINENTPVYQIALSVELPCGFQSGEEVILKSGVQPVELRCDLEIYYLSLRPVSVPLPVTLRLVDFSKKFHPGTEILKEVGSHLSIRSNNLERDVIISMNKPLRYGSYAFYQASFSHEGEKEITNLSVVYNPHRLFPYIASMLMMGGFIIHLVILIIKKIAKTKPIINNEQE